MAVSFTHHINFLPFYNPSLILITLIFTGDKKSGTFKVLEMPTYTGPYAVDGKKVTITFNNFFPSIKSNGEFTGKDSMSGTLVDDEDDFWNWTATRQAGAAAVEPSLAGYSRLFRK